MKHRLISFVLALAVACSSLPAPALALAAAQPSASSSAAASDSTTDTSEVTPPEEPETTTPEEPEVTPPEEPEATTPEEPEATTPEEPEATTPEEPEATPEDPAANSPAVSVLSNGTLSYVDRTGAAQSYTGEYTDVAADTLNWTEGWYLASGDVTLSERVTVSGNVNLILANGAHLNTEKGIEVLSGNSLTIAAQSTGDSAGSLTATTDNDAAAPPVTPAPSPFSVV